MRLLVGCLLMLIALVYFQSERHDCSVRMSVDNWFLCITRGVDLGKPLRGLLSLPKQEWEAPLRAISVQTFLILARAAYSAEQNFSPRELTRSIVVPRSAISTCFTTILEMVRPGGASRLSGQHRAAIIRLPPLRCYGVGRECGELGEIIRVIFEAIVIALESGRLTSQFDNLLNHQRLTSGNGGPHR